MRYFLLNLKFSRVTSEMQSLCSGINFVYEILMMKSKYCKNFSHVTLLTCQKSAATCQKMCFAFLYHHFVSANKRFIRNYHPSGKFQVNIVGCLQKTVFIFKLSLNNEIIIRI